MKLFSLSLVALLAVAFSAAAQTPVGPGSVKLGKVEVAAINTPEFQISGGPQKRSKIGKWLEMEVEYATIPEEIDELTFKYSVLLEKKLLTGDVTYVSIRKAKDHYAVMYISPKVIDRLTGGKPLTGVDNVWIEVSHQGQVLDKGSFKPGNPPNAQQVAGLISNKNDTPFAPLFFDRYETIKQGR
jgi:hypothetical protein